MLLFLLIFSALLDIGKPHYKHLHLYRLASPCGAASVRGLGLVLNAMEGMPTSLWGYLLHWVLSQSEKGTSSSMETTQAEAKLARIEPTPPLARVLLGPKLRAKFPHLAALVLVVDESHGRHLH